MKKNLKVMIIISLVCTVIFGGGLLKKTDTYKKYKLAAMAYTRGYEDITIGRDRVSFTTDTSLMTYYPLGYNSGIKELSGK